MIKLRAEIKKILENIHPQVYHIDTKNKKGYPYLVYDLSDGYADENLELFNLDIEVWDSPLNDDTTEVERISQLVWDELNGYHGINEDMQFSIYRQSRSRVEDDEPRIKRRTLIFNLRYYDRRVN